VMSRADALPVCAWKCRKERERAGACAQAAGGCGREVRRPGRFADGTDVESFALKLPTITTRFNRL